MSLPPARQRRRRALAHQCPQCRRHWALRLVEHPAGSVVLCRHCQTVRRVLPQADADPTSSGRPVSTA